MNEQEKASQFSTGVFFVGLGFLFLTGWWWPGIMFVIAVSILARAMTLRQPLSSATGAWWMIGLGLLFGGKYRPRVSGKRKNDEDPRQV